MRRLSMRFLIIVTFVTLLSVTVGSLTFLTFMGWKKSVDRTIDEMEQKVNNDILKEIDDLVQLPLQTNDMNYFCIQNGLVDMKDPIERNTYFANMVKASDDEIYSISYGLEDGEYYGARKNAANQIEVYHSNASTDGHSFYYKLNNDYSDGAFIGDYGLFDPRTREWYRLAKERGIPTLAPLYKHFVKDDLALSAAYPIYDKNGRLQGVLGTHIVLNNLNDRLQQIMVPSMGNACILEADTGALVANSFGISNISANQEGFYDRLLINDLKQDKMDQAYHKFISSGQTESILKSEEENTHLKVTSYKNSGLNWVVVTAIPESSFVIELKLHQNITIVIIIAAIIFSIVICIESINYLLRPINNLIDTAYCFSKGVLYQRAVVYRNDEIGKLAVSFNHMADELHQNIYHLEEMVIERTLELEDTVLKLKESNDALMIAKEKAEAANLAKSQFLANMSHEIRTPMNGIMGFLQLLEISPLNEEQQDYVKMIRTSSDTLLQVINEILDLSKIEAGMMRLEQIDFSLRSVIEESVFLFQASAREKGLTLQLQLCDRLPDQVIGDPTKLKQILNNLISNAVKFTGHGEIIVAVSKLSEERNRVILSFKIQDTGIGMTDSDMEKLFIPFSQVDASLTRKYGGTGLGLSICKRMVDLLGGTIEVTSTINVGSTFVFTLPFFIINSTLRSEQKKEEKVAQPATAELRQQWSKPVILLAEDNDINKKFFINMLKNLGLACDVVSNGTEAVTACQTAEYDLIFMDCQLPVMDGFEATRQIRQLEGERRHTTIIAITAFAMSGDEKKCIAAGMDDYLSKPVVLQEAVKLIRKYTGYSVTLQESESNESQKIVWQLMLDMDFNQEEAEELVHDFAEQAVAMLIGIRQLVLEGNLTEARHSLHQLKGSAGNIRAKTVADYAKAAEQENNQEKILDHVEKMLLMIQRLIKP